MMNYDSNKMLLFHLFTLFSLCACASTTGPAEKTEKIGIFKLLEQADQAYGRGQWIEAERYYQSVTEKAPNDYYAWFRLGNTRLRQHHLPSAIQSYKSASQRKPEHAKPYYNLATAYLFQAQEALQQSWHRLPEKDTGRLLIAQKLEQLKKLVYTPVEDIQSPARGLIKH